MIPEIGYLPFDDNKSVIAPDEAEPNSIFIFDGVACEKQQHNYSSSFFVWDATRE